MALVKSTHWGNVRPRGMPRLDLGNTITRQMLRAYVFGYNNRTPLELLTGAGSWTVESEVGLRVEANFNGSMSLYAGNYTQGLSSSENAYRLSIENTLTACVLFREGKEDGGAAANQMYFANSSVGINTPVNYNWGIQSLHIGNGQQRLRGIVRSGGVDTATAQFVQANEIYLLGLICNGESLQLWRNGQLLSSVAFTGAIDQTNLATSFLRSQPGATPGLSGYFYWAGIWNRALGEEEMRWLNNNRWGLFAAAGSRVYSLPSQSESAFKPHFARHSNIVIGASINA